MGGELSVASLLGQGCILHTNLCAGPYVHTDAYTRMYTHLHEVRALVGLRGCQALYKRALEPDSRKRGCLSCGPTPVGSQLCLIPRAAGCAGGGEGGRPRAGL